jgi:uncharacterized repeat protein (TIGR01451 family)
MRNRTSLLILWLAPSVSLALNVSIMEYGDGLCGNPNGFATAYAFGGTPPYSFLWSNGATTATAQGLVAGTYTVTVTDAASATATTEVTIGEVPSTLYVSFSGAGLHGCNGLCNGGRNITVYPLPANLAQPVTFWPPLNVDNGGPVDGSYGLYTGLCPGQQLEFTVTDGNGCTIQVIDTWAPESSIPSPMSILNVTPSCSAIASGSVTIDAGIDAASPFGVIWEVVILNEAMQQVGGAISGLSAEPGQNIGTREGLAPGNYYAQRRFIWHPNDCADLLPFTIGDLGIDCGLLTGIAFVDNNLTCTREFNEPLVPSSILEIQPGPYYATTTITGQYSVVLPPGSYTVEHQDPVLDEHCTGAPIPFTITNGAMVTVDHPDTSIVPLDVSVSLSSGAARPGFQVLYGMEVKNLTPTSSGNVTISYTYDPTIQFLSANPTPSSVVGNTITWNQFSLFAWQTIPFTLGFQVPPDVGLLGYELVTIASATTTNTDGDLSNNSATNLRTITGAYDPNDKLAYTSGGSSEAWIINEDEWIDYTIRFQNTGTDTAFNVVITDTLPANLDPATLVMGPASHSPLQWELRGEGTLRVSFPNILLPDSNVNEPRSHGFVGFRIRPRLPLLPGDEIINSANIYFDFNPPIITEPSILMAEFSTGVAGSGTRDRPLIAIADLTRGTLLLSAPGHTLIDGLLRDMNGRIVLHQGLHSDPAVLNVSALASGAYVAEVHTTHGQLLRTKVLLTR